jgi:hypothetical protein
LAGDVLQKYAIFGAGVFDNRCPQADALQVFFSHLPHRYFQEISDYLNFRLSNPDVTLARP